MDNFKTKENNTYEEFQWVQCRLQMLDIIEGKLVQMKSIVEEAIYDDKTAEQIKLLNDSLNYLLEQVKALDAESRKTSNEIII